MTCLVFEVRESVCVGVLTSFGFDAPLLNQTSLALPGNYRLSRLVALHVGG